jgi:hypothetical protein
VSYRPLSFIKARSTWPTHDRTSVLTARTGRTKQYGSGALQIFVFGTGAPVARQRVRQSGATRRQARVCDLQQLLSEFWNHERHYDGRGPSWRRIARVAKVPGLSSKRCAKERLDSSNLCSALQSILILSNQPLWTDSGSGDGIHDPLRFAKVTPFDALNRKHA